MKVIEEFWYGNLYPMERPFYRRRKVEKILKLLNQNEEKLLESLNEDERNLFQKYKECNDEIMSKDTCYLTDEEIKIRTDIIKDKNRAYIEGFGYAAPSKTKIIMIGSDGDINKIVGTMN